MTPAEASLKGVDRPPAIKERATFHQNVPSRTLTGGNLRCSEDRADFWAVRNNYILNLFCDMRKMPKTAMAAISSEPAKISAAPGLPLRSRASPAAGVNSVIPT